MTEPGFTDRATLTGSAYADSAHLRTRRAIYRFCVPPFDLTGWALGHVRPAPEAIVLDVGCGPGDFLRRLPGHARPLGLDLSAGMAAEAARAGFPAAAADVQALPLPDRSVDVALAMHVLYHVPDIDRAARELRRVLTPDGVLLVSTNGAGHMGRLDEVLLAAAGAPPGSPGPMAATLARFNLDSGEPILRAHFASVERHEFHGEVVVDDPDPVVAYIASGRSFGNRTAAPVEFDTFLEALRTHVRRVIEREGAFRARINPGVFVCRDAV